MLLFSAIGDGQVKSWIDEQGVTHYGNDPRPTPEPPKNETINCTIDWQDSKKLAEAKYRRQVETALGQLKACHVAVEASYLRDDMALQRAAIGRSGSLLIEIQTRRQLLPLKKIETLAPIKSHFLALEKNIKERYSGALPDWVKDNREWRYLDKAFQP